MKISKRFFHVVITCYDFPIPRTFVKGTNLKIHQGIHKQKTCKSQNDLNIIFSHWTKKSKNILNSVILNFSTQSFCQYLMLFRQMFLFYIKNLFNFLKCVYFSRQYFTFSFLLIMTNKQIMYIQFTQSILFWFSYATLEGISGYILYISYMKRKSFSLLNILRCFDGERKKKLDRKLS